MLKTLLATTALTLMIALPAGAAVQTDDAAQVATTSTPALQLASNGSGSNSGPGGGGGHGSGHDDNDDDNDDDDSGSGRSKPRIPGGSGCDDAGDVEEHASCSPSAL